MPADADFEDTPSGKHPDLAILRIDDAFSHPHVKFDLRPTAQHALLSSFGFGESDSIGGETVTVTHEGPAYMGRGSIDRKPRMKLKGGQYLRGMSGSPIYDSASLDVVGVVTHTRDEYSELGGFAISTSVIISKLSEHRDQFSVSQDNEHDESVMLFSAPISQDSAGQGKDNQREVALVRRQLDEVLALRRRGQPRAALAKAIRCVEEIETKNLPAPLLGRALRAQAVCLLESDQHVTEARALLDRAALLDVNQPEIEKAAATLAHMTEGVEAAARALTPETSDEIDAIRAGYLLRFDVPEAARILSSLSPAELDKPRTRRLELLLAILRYDRPKVLALSERLVFASRDDASIGFLVIAGMVLASLPTVFWFDPTVAWPQPIPRAELLVDEDSHSRLKTAFELATALLNNVESDDETQSDLEIWALAALALDDVQKDKAEEYAATLLTREVPNHRAIPWVWFLQLSIDLDPTYERIEHSASQGSADAEKIIILAIREFRRNQFDRALEVLRANRAYFIDEPAQAKYRLYEFEALVMGGHIDEAEGLLAEITDQTDRTSAEILLVESATSGSAARAYDIWQRTRDGRALLSAAEFAHRNADWDFLSSIGGELLEEIGSASAARFALYGAYNAKNYDQAIDLFQKFQSSGLLIPNDFFKIRAYALDRLGQASAIEAFDDLLNEDPTDDNFYSAGYARLRRGDTHGVKDLARRLLQSGTASQRTAFAFCSWLRPFDVLLAQQLWRYAMSLGAPPDELVVLAFSLANQLGLGEEGKELAQPLARLAETGSHGIRAFTQDEAIEILRDARTRTQDILSAYRRGELPVHLLSAETNVDIVATHIEQPRLNANGITRFWGHVYVRHGNRTTAESQAAVKTRAFLDVTSFLLAHDLNVIDDIVEAFGPVMVSSRLGSLLTAALDERSPETNARKRALKTLVHGINTGAFQVKSTADLDDPSTFLIDWATPDTIKKHGNTQRAWCSPRHLADWLLRQGTISAAAHASAISRLANVADDGGTDPSAGVPLFLHWNVAEMLIELGITSALRDHVLNVEAEYLGTIRAELANDDHRESIASWIRSLLNTFNGSINHGDIVTIDAPESEREPGLAMSVSLAMFSQSLPDGSFVVVDDRYFHAFRTRDDGKPVVALHDVLRAMLQNGTLSLDRFRHVTTEMRRRGLMYIPISSDEIVHRVRQMPIVNDRFAPTEELNVLKRYIASMLLDTEALAGAKLGDTPPPEPPAPPRATQAPFLFELSQAIRGAVADLLRDGSDEGAVRAKWVHQNLSIDGLPGFGLTALRTASLPAQLVIDIENAAYLMKYLTE